MSTLWPSLLLAASTLLSGCISSKYKLVSKQTIPAVQLNMTGSNESVDAVLHSVIVHRGPGSWKREAYWDEYVISLANRGDTAVVVESATLVDFQGSANGPGVDPWKLDRESKTWWQRAKSSQTGNLLVLGAGAVGLTTAFAAGVLLTSGVFGPLTATGTAFAGAAYATVYGAPVYAVAVVVINSKNKKKVSEEFERRRIPLPAPLAAGQMRQGSLYFRISPSPRQLTFRCRPESGAPPFDLIVDLAPLSGLHMKPKEKT